MIYKRLATHQKSALDQPVGRDPQFEKPWTILL